MERVLATEEPQYADPLRYARAGIQLAEGGHEMKECAGENRVILTAGDFGMGLMRGREVKEHEGEEKAISTADGSDMGMARAKEGVSVKNVVAATLERAREHYKENALEHYKESALGGQTKMLPLRRDRVHQGRWNGEFGRTTSHIPPHLPDPKDRDQRILRQVLHWGAERLIAGSVWHRQGPIGDHAQVLGRSDSLQAPP